MQQLLFGAYAEGSTIGGRGREAVRYFCRALLDLSGMLRKGFARRVLHDARTAAQMAHARPAYAAGVRAAIATVTPLILASLLPAGTATWASLAGLNVALSDRGGPYRTRAKMMTALACAMGVVVAVGSLAGGHLVLSIIVTFVVAVLCGLARAWTDVGPIFGIAPLTTFAIALAIPVPTPAAALIRFGAIVGGGAWAMVLAVLLWPILPYRPVRLRIAECYRSIARYVEAAAEGFSRGEAYEPWTITSHVVAVRTAVESARTALAVSRRGRASESGRGERLLVLHEIADQIFVHMIALLEESDLGQAAESATTREGLTSTLMDVAETVRAIASAIESEVDVPRIRVAWSGASLQPVNASMAEMVDRIANYAGLATGVTAALNSGTVPSQDRETIDVAEPPPEPVLFSLAAIVRPSSLVLHHALRVAIVTTAAVLITGLLHLNHGYWVTLTAVVILQPYAATTRQKALQRVVGTILGGVVAAGLSAFFHNATAVLLLVALFTTLCVALLPLNYGAYAVFGTPAFVLLAESSAGDWHLAGLRVVNTLIGGGLALLGARLLWPGDERNHLPEFAAAALRANAEFLRGAMALVGRGAANLGSLRDVRRAVAEAAFNSEDSFQRLMSEHRGPPDVLEPIMTFLIYTRRIAASIAAFAVVAESGSRLVPDAMQRFERMAGGVLTNLAESVVQDTAPASFPPISAAELPDPLTEPVAHQRLMRLASQLQLMHSAVTRWMGAEPASARESTTADGYTSARV